MQSIAHNILGILLFTLCLSANAQIDTWRINDSPYNVIQGHSYYLRENTYEPQKAAIAIPKSTKNRADVAVKLKKVLDGMGINVGLLRIPKDANYIDSLSQREVYFLYPLERRIYVEKEKGKWYYSKETIAQLDQMYSEIYILDINFKQYFPASFWYKKLFGITFIKWLGILLLTPLCFLAYIISKSIYYFLVKRYVGKKFEITQEVKDELKKSSKLLGLFVGTKLFNALLPQIQLPVAWNAFLLRTVGIASTLILIALISKTIDALFAYYKIKSASGKDNQVLPIVNRILKVSIWIIGIVYILQYMGVNVITLLTGLSIGGLVLALAAQDTVKNLIGSVMIFIDRPFKIGDWVKFNDMEGEVEEIGVRSTRIRTFEDSLIYVPNSILADHVVNNMGLRKNRSFKTKFKVENNLPVEKLNHFIEQLKKIIVDHPDTLKDRFEVRLNAIEDGLPSILFYCFFKTNTYESELKSRHEILTQVLGLSEKEGIVLALPSKKVYNAPNT